MSEADHSIPDHYGMILEVLETEFESCWRCGAVVYRRNSGQHDIWHQSQEAGSPG